MLKSYEEVRTVKATPSGSQFTFMENGDLGLGIIGKIIGPMAQRSSAATIDKMLAKLKKMTKAYKTNIYARLPSC